MTELLRLERLRVESAGAIVLRAEAIQVNLGDAPQLRVGLLGDWSAFFGALTGELAFRGTLLIEGTVPLELLRTGGLAVVPARLEVPQNLSVAKLLGYRAHARFPKVGRSARQKLVEQSLARTGLHELAKQRIGRIGALAQRKLVLALADVVGAPILAIEDPFECLEDGAAQEIATTLAQVAEGRHLICSNSATSRFAQDWLSTNHTQLFIHEGVVQAVETGTTEYWRVTATRHLSQLSATLESRGVEVSGFTRLDPWLDRGLQRGRQLGERGGVLIARLPPRTTTELIVEAAVDSDAPLVGLQSLMVPPPELVYEASPAPKAGSDASRKPSP